MPFDPARAIADLHALADQTGGRDTGGARRVCWTDEWVKARGYVREQLEATGADIERDEAGSGQIARRQKHRGIVRALYDSSVTAQYLIPPESDADTPLVTEPAHRSASSLARATCRPARCAHHPPRACACQCDTRLRG